MLFNEFLAISQQFFHSHSYTERKIDYNSFISGSALLIVCSAVIFLAPGARGLWSAFQACGAEMDSSLTSK